jgi:hypothetical protein
MKRVLLLALVLLVVFLYVCRQRVYLHDPLANVVRSGQTDPDTHVLINYSNDILLYDHSGGRDRIYLVQNWNLTPSVPGQLMCVAFLLCLTDNDHATAAPIDTRGRLATMSNKEVDFFDEDGAPVTVTVH